MINPLIISDIATTEILFFDETFKDKCFRFCKQRDIDFLPSLDSPSEIYVRDDEDTDFKIKKITPDQIIYSDQKVFQQKILDVFRENNLLFIYSMGELTGVVHFSDFNKSIVTTYLFNVFFKYEKHLRELLKKYGYSNKNMVEFFESKANFPKSNSFFQKKLDSYNRNQEKINKLPPFQSFYLDDLIRLANTKYNDLNEEVIELRNMIMHAHELVNKHDWNEDNYIFNFDTFENFFQRAIILHKDFERVKNKIKFLKDMDESLSYE
jgi:hypothetical protein